MHKCQLPPMVYKKMKLGFMEGNVNLRKWRTNCEELRAIIDGPENSEVRSGGWISRESVEEENRVKLTDSGQKIRCIGTEWNEEAERNILRVLASYYNSLKLIQPVIIKTRLLFHAEVMCCEFEVG